MTNRMLTANEIAELAAAAAAFRKAGEGDSGDAEYDTGCVLADLAEALTKPGEAEAVPTFPHAIANPFEVYVYLDPAGPDAASYPNGIAMGCTSLEHAEVMFDVETLTRGFPWWITALLVERAPGGRPATVVARHKRDITATTWRRPDPSGS